MNEPLPLWTSLIILATSIVSWLGFRNRTLEQNYIFHPQSILAGKEYHRIVTSAFLHSDLRHLLWNMLTLYFFGRSIEFMLGPADFLVIYFGAVIGGSLLSLYVHRHHEYLAYGASGGVCGLIFAYVLLEPRGGIYMYFVPFAIPGWLYAIGYILLSFYGMKENKGNVGHDAHLGGAIIGFLITAALHPDAVRQNPKVFLLVLVPAILLLVYLWFNPLFLSVHSFFSRPLKRKARDSTLPKHKWENLEIDRVLEKVANRGMDSLTDNEKALLEDVSGKYRRRADSKKPGSGLAI